MALLTLVGCFLLALLLRLPVLSLPLEGEGAGLATRGALMGREEAFHLEEVRHRGPLLPMLLAVPVGAGWTPTGALRATDVLLGALLSALAALVAFRLGVGRRAAGLVGVLTALHPGLAVHAGGALAGTAGLVAVLTLGGLMLVGSVGVRRRRAGAVVAAILPLADPLAVAFGVALLVTWFRREGSFRARTILVGVFALFLVFAPLPALGAEGGIGTRLLAFAFQWVPLAGLVVLLPAAYRGVGLLWGGRHPRDLAAAWLIGGAAYLLLLLVLPVSDGFAFGLDEAPAAAPLVPLVITLGVAGLGLLPRPWPTRLWRSAIVLAAAGALFAVLGPVQTFVLPEAPAAAGRLDRLARSVRAAREAAGRTGWVALDLDARLDPVEIERLMDLVPDQPVGRLPRRAPGTEDPTTLLLDDLPAEAAVGIVTSYRPEVLGVTTLDGGGIYRQEPTARFGPWLVLRAIRP